MLNSIVIPHRDMNGHLAWCLWSIRRSAAATGIADYEVLVVDGGSKERPCVYGESRESHERFIYLGVTPVFNKPKLLNIGIGAARGNVLTFLDADMLVGQEWLAGVSHLEDPALIRVCYRVRHLSVHRWLQLQHSTDREKYTSWLFERYNHFDLAFEAYGHHNLCAQPTTETDRQRVFGNSQFSVRRENLRDLRPNESLAGHGTEDLEFSQQFDLRFGCHYVAFLDIKPLRCLLHLPHEHEWPAAGLPQCAQTAVVDAEGRKRRESIRYLPPYREEMPE